jgi:hypothetical protein
VVVVATAETQDALPQAAAVAVTEDFLQVAAEAVEQ